MAISSNGLAGLKPGVVDSTATRPSAPYEGQVIFQKDTDQLLVWNGTAWVIPNQTTQNPEGLELIKTQTVGTGVSSVTVTDAFSSTYENYLVTYNGATNTGGEVVRMQLGATVTGYYGTMIYAGYGGGAVSIVGDNNAANWTHCSGGVNNFTNLQATIMRPFASAATSISSPYQDGANAGHKTGYLNNSTSYTAFTLLNPSYTITGGTIRVYGYRN